MTSLNNEIGISEMEGPRGIQTGDTSIPTEIYLPEPEWRDDNHEVAAFYRNLRDSFRGLSREQLYWERIGAQHSVALGDSYLHADLLDNSGD